MFVEHVNNLPAIYGVARQSVGQPRQNPVCFARLNPLHQVAEHGSPWYFGGLFFNQLVYDGQALIFCVCPQFYELCLNR